MSTVCSTNHPDNRSRYQLMRAEGLGMAKSVLNKALDANQAIAMRQLDVYSMQADEAKAAVLNDKLDECQKIAAVKRSYAIRADMNYQVQRHTTLNTLIAFGSMVLEAVV